MPKDATPFCDRDALYISRTCRLKLGEVQEGVGQLGSNRHLSPQLVTCRKSRFG